ncbi:hypothetical protein MKK84_24545 [Methylobacterium sp. E-065]|uniref:hypothetical protein n=1 Tax=Methylobacterium sp. E-065 TaxID=2836583 RepID=UPI001FB9B9A3|nr:hypothetical protein [Methylobacterium sp. E-065]MCJ2020558.1 hypothetical protein [Methylobacterium sp. E-065]
MDPATALARALTVLGPFFDTQSFKAAVSRSATAEIRFCGPIGKPEIDRLMRHLEIFRDSFPDEAEPMPSEAELAKMIRDAMSAPIEEIRHG